jgi:DNA-binding XRE family transcriptional regulator
MGLAMPDRPHSRLDMLEPRQLRAARALVGWSRQVLADKSGVPRATIEQFEAGKTDPKQTTVHKLRRALERVGVVFQEADDEEWGPGVRLRAGKRKVPPST